MFVRIANREDPDQTASSEYRSSLIWVCTVCLGPYGRQQLFEILEHLLYLCILMNSSIWVDTMKLRLLIIHIEGSQVIFFHIEDAVKSLMIVFILADSADLDEMAHPVSLHLGFHLQSTFLWFSSTPIIC